MFEIIDHTADIGIHVTGHTLRELFEKAAEGMAFIILESDMKGLESQWEMGIEGEGSDWETLLVSFLSEILYLIEAKGVLPISFKNSGFSHDRFITTAGFVPLGDNCILKREIKAVTCHGMNIELIDGEYHTDVIFDV